MIHHFTQDIKPYFAGSTQHLRFFHAAIEVECADNRVTLISESHSGSGNDADMDQAALSVISVSLGWDPLVCCMSLGQI